VAFVSFRTILLYWAFIQMPNTTMLPQTNDPFYYLTNFLTVLDWIISRYLDLLDSEENDFIRNFIGLPKSSQALLVRMVMRKGDFFRESKLHYPEIGNTADAAAPLINQGWIHPAPELTLEQIFQIFTKPELVRLFKLPPALANAKKAAQLDAIRTLKLNASPTDTVYHLQITPLADRLRLMFFGNLHQDWTEFILTDLGIYTYETVGFSCSERGFQTRADLTHYHTLYTLREQWQQGANTETILAHLEQLPHSPQSWLELRRAKLQFNMARQYEREKNWPAALALYQNNPSPEARIRYLRVLIHHQQFNDAHQLAQQIAQHGNEMEQQQLLRILPRLQRKLNIVQSKSAPPQQWQELQITLPAPKGLHNTEQSIEQRTAQHLSDAARPVFYVENTLINTLFGLLCWEAIFAPLPGAFFHPYQRGPADLHSPDFYSRRQTLFERCLQELDSDAYQHTIRRHFLQKSGLQSPFVVWQLINKELLDLALHCLPAHHLQRIFQRILADVSNNRSGLPDLIQFWPNGPNQHHENHPQTPRYRMIEVKGPGDRLQDKQIRWLNYFGQHHIPVMVCYVQYQAHASAQGDGGDDGDDGDGDTKISIESQP
jgi:hypothetical protein